MVTKNNGHVVGNANSDIKQPKENYTKGVRGTKVKGRYVKPPYMRTNG